ncbi:MAG: AAA-like domain-containing protein [Fimbriimonas sp.]|nr:AAA-like domain-containing protein [Fimbriimonas sp.]
MRTVRTNDFFVSGGTLPLDSASYIQRDCDKVLFNALRESRYCYVLNTRQMGKSSLSVRVLADLESAGWKTVSIDLTQMGGRNVTPEQWYAGLASEVGRALGIRAEVLQYYRDQEAVGPMRRFFAALRDVVLEHFEQPVTICIDEIDATRNLPFDTDEFFAGIRECFNHRVVDPAYQRLTFCLIGVAVANDLIRNQTTTPFNIGERIYLADFTLAEMRKLELPLGPNARQVVERIHFWTDGHPFLSQSLCSAIWNDEGLQTRNEVDRLVRDTFLGPKARDRNVNLADVANRVLNSAPVDADSDGFRADVLSTYQKILAGRVVSDDEANRTVSVLKLSGLVRSTGGRLRVRNRIYERVFDRAWIRENMPGQEVARQLQSFRRGLVRATVVYGLVLAAVAILGLATWNSERKATAARAALDREVYVADMNNLRSFEEDGDEARIAEILERTRNSPYRGFEWGYWLNRLHDSKEEYSLDYFAPGKRERGVLSRDNRSICLIDDLTLTASVVDRVTKKLVRTVPLRSRDEVMATHIGFVIVNYDTNPGTVTELLTGKLVSTFGGSHVGFEPQSSQEDSDFLLIRERGPKGLAPDNLTLWNVTTGKRVFDYTVGSSLSLTQVMYSNDGSRFLMCENRDGLTNVRVSVWNTSTNSKIDEFTLPARSMVLNISTDGSQVIYTDGTNALGGRNTLFHQAVFRRSLVAGENPVAARFADKDRAIAVMDGTGTVSVEEYPAGRSMGSRFNVWNLSSSMNGGLLVTSSSSVRVIDVHQVVAASVISRGFRVGRDGLGHIIVFGVSPRWLLQLTDPTLSPIRYYGEKPGLRMYTYNGRWALIVDQRKHVAWLNDTSGRYPDVQIVKVPVNFSCGLQRDTMAIYVPQSGEINGLSAIDGSLRWSYRLPDPRTNGVWVTPDGKNVIAFSGGKYVVVLDARTGKLRGVLEPHNLRVSNLTFTSDGAAFFTFGADGRVTLWDIATLTQRMEFRGNTGQRVTSADLSPDGRRVVTTTEGGSWLIYDAATGVLLTTVKATVGPLRGALFTSDGKRLVTVGADDVVRVWQSLDRDPSVRVPVDAAFLKGIKR